MFVIQRQRTAGAYITIKTATSHKKAVEELRAIAAEHPERPYNGEDKWQDGNNVHHVNRYRIAKL